MEKSNYQGMLQSPIGSGFNAASTAADVIKGMDLTGKMAIILLLMKVMLLLKR